jgi:hypothetical protein
MMLNNNANGGVIIFIEHCSVYNSMLQDLQHLIFTFSLSILQVLSLLFYRKRNCGTRVK